MALPTGLTQDEINELLYSQIQTINAVLCITTPGFNTDILDYFSTEMNPSTILNAASKTKLKDHMGTLKTKYKRK